MRMEGGLSTSQVELDARKRNALQTHGGLGRGLLGSTNQTIHLLTSRYRMADFDRIPPAEVRITPTGVMRARIAGFPVP